MTGAGSVVTRDIPPHSPAVGSPYRVTRSLTAAERMEPCEIPACVSGCQAFTADNVILINSSMVFRPEAFCSSA